ncbi:MAG: DNA polymerase III subunit gamma/tau, partial [Chloroflexi bacterium]|nr:DNA polymerase III subunit gamma/tau [Chloroflexota bacterium]
MPEPKADRRALYLRWRPARFADVVGQEPVVRTLRNAAASGRPGHAYLLCGPRGTGKTSLARIFYRAVNCLNPEVGDPCGVCTSCEAALHGRAMDLVEIDAASNRGIDDIRQLRERVSFSPTDARYRVYIVDEAHELTAPAWDAFLKTLEEPPAHTIFVLATTEAHKIPGTIVSRCQRFDLRRIPAAEIRKQLARIALDEGLDVQEGALERLARMGKGGLRDAISLLDQAAAYGGGRVDIAALRDMLGLADPATLQGLVEAVVGKDAGGALVAVADMLENGADLRLSADEMTTYVRGLTLQQAGAAQALREELAPEELEWLAGLERRADGPRLRQLLLTVSEALARVRDAAQFQLQFELALLEACDAAATGETEQRSTTAAPGPRRPARATSADDVPSPGTVSAPPTRVVSSGEASSADDASGSERPLRPSATAARSRALGRAAPPPDDRPPFDDAPPFFDEPQEWSGVGDDARAVPAPATEPSRVVREVEVGELSLASIQSRWTRLIEAVAKRNAFVASYLQ